MEDQFLTVAEIAERLRVNQQTVRNWIDRGELAAVRIGARRIRVRQSELDRFIAAGETSASSVAVEAERQASEESVNAWGRVRAALVVLNAAVSQEDPADLRGALDAFSDAEEKLTESLNAEPAGDRVQEACE
jgi:excisionase family DNA binding protein